MSRLSTNTPNTLCAVGLVLLPLFVALPYLFMETIGLVIGLIVAIPIGIILIKILVQNAIQDIKTDAEKIKKIEKETENLQHDGLWILPSRPNYSGNAEVVFYQQMEKQVKPYFIQLWQNEMEYGWINVNYHGFPVLQIVNLPKGTTKKNLCLWFYPYAFDDALEERFPKNNPYFSQFVEINPSEPDAFMQADYRTDISMALKVASYLLAAICYIPATYQFSFE